MARAVISTKRLAISKANAQMVAILAIASFVTVFCLIASRALFSQSRYQARVIAAKEEADNQLDSNLEAFADLQNSYKKFAAKNPNIIGGQKDGAADNDGDNAKIILDALPSTYDFPALTSSLEKVLNSLNVQITAITGTDDQLSQQSNTSSADPEAIEMPFSFSISGTNYTTVQSVIDTLQRSIRPIQIDSIDVAGGGSDMSLTVKAHTYYQPAKNLNITKKVVK